MRIRRQQLGDRELGDVFATTSLATTSLDSLRRCGLVAHVHAELVAKTVAKAVAKDAIAHLIVRNQGLYATQA